MITGMVTISHPATDNNLSEVLRAAIIMGSSSTSSSNNNLIGTTATGNTYGFYLDSTSNNNNLYQSNASYNTKGEQDMGSTSPLQVTTILRV